MHPRGGGGVPGPYLGWGTGRGGPARGWGGGREADLADVGERILPAAVDAREAHRVLVDEVCDEEHGGDDVQHRSAQVLPLLTGELRNGGTLRGGGGGGGQGGGSACLEGGQL